MSTRIIGHADIAADLLRRGADVNFQDAGGFSALIYAVLGGRIDAVRVLLAAPGIDVNITDIHGGTALPILGNAHRAIAALLRAAGAH